MKKDDKKLKMPRPLTVFLTGVLLGILLILPTTLQYRNKPRMEAVIVSDSIYQRHLKNNNTFYIDNVPTWGGQKKTLVIHIDSQAAVNRALLEDYPERTKDNPSVLGFYNPNTHEIWCVNSVDVLVHEVRHVFERYFHQ